MAVDVDYYAVIDVARDADADAIEAAIKKSVREWRKRTEAADLGVRQEAEVKMGQIEEARTTLMDATKRAAYDRDLAGGVKQPTQATPGASPTGESWLERAEGYLAVADYHSAAYAAREATQVEGTNARTWWIRSRANAGLKLWQDALYEARQATQIEESNAEYHFNLGLIQEEMGTYGDAIDSFRRAGSCDPTNPTYELAVGGIFLQNGRPLEALPIIEAVYTKHPNDENANYYLGMALIDAAESIPKIRKADTYWITSQAEIDSMRSYAKRATSLNIVDPDIKKQAYQITSYLDKMEQKAWRMPKDMIANVVGGMGEAGCAGAAIGVAVAGAIMFLPLILIMSGFGSMGSNPGAGFLMILAGGAIGYLYFRLSYIPRWKHNKKDFR